MAGPGTIIIQHCQVCPDQTPLLSALCQKCGYIFGFCCNCGSICEYCAAIENAGFFNPDEVIKVLVEILNTPEKALASVPKLSSIAIPLMKSPQSASSPPSHQSLVPSYPSGSETAGIMAAGSPYTSETEMITFEASYSLEAGSSNPAGAELLLQPCWIVKRRASRKRTDLLEDGLGNSYTKRSACVWQCTRMSEQNRNKCPAIVKEKHGQYYPDKIHSHATR